jgi:hypothetical protein
MSALSRWREDYLTSYPLEHGNSAVPKNRVPWVIIAILVICQVAGVAALVKSDEIALTTLSNESEFIWFWLGMILIELPIAGLIARSATSQAARSALLILFGIITFAPKLLRTPIGPTYHDEYAHWRATSNILTSGKLFEPAQIVPIIEHYPALHIVTAAMVNVTGLSIWQSATILLVLFHLMLVLGIVALARSIGLNSRAAALAGIIYSFNSSFLYFDTQFAYESMAITLLVWILVAFVQAIRATNGRVRSIWCFVTILLCAGLVPTHHLSSLTLTMILAIISLALSIPPLAGREGWVRTAIIAWALTLSMAAMFWAWVFFIAPETVSYLSPYLGNSLGELMQIVSRSGSSRQLFSASLSPWWEHQAAYLVTLVALFIAAMGMILVRRRTKKRALPNGVRDALLPAGRRRSIFISMCFLGLVYFPSTILILSPAGAEGARRSWADTWIGLAVSTAPAVVWLIEWVESRFHVLSRCSGRVVLALVMIITLVGGTAAGLDPTYRFPGPFLFGSDSRSETPELDAMSQWFMARFGTENRIVTDRFTALVMGSFGQQDPGFPSAGFPAYDLYSDPAGKPIGPQFLLYQLQSSHYLYLIVDERLARDIPQVGVYFEPDEPIEFITNNGKSYFAGRLGKFNTVHWMYKVLQSNNYSVYRMALPPPKITYQSRTVHFQGKLTVQP